MQSVISMWWRTITATLTGECNSASFSHLSSPKCLNGFLCRFVCSRGLLPNACRHSSVSTVRVWKKTKTNKEHTGWGIVFWELFSLYLSLSTLLSPIAKAKRRKDESVQQVLSNLLNGFREASQMHTYLTIFCLDLYFAWTFCHLIRVKLLATAQKLWKQFIKLIKTWNSMALMFHEFNQVRMKGFQVHSCWKQWSGDVQTCTCIKGDEYEDTNEYSPSASKDGKNKAVRTIQDYNK